jgi:signal transduction histidine kinase
MSIRVKLLASYIALTSLGMSLLAGYILWSFRDYYLRTEQADLTIRASAVSESIADALERHDWRRAAMLVQRHSSPERLNIRVFLGDGKLLATSAPEHDSHVRDWTPVPGVVKGLRGEPNRGIEDVPGSTTDDLYDVRPMRRAGKLIGVLRMSLRLDQFRRQWNHLVRAVLGSLVACFGVCLLLSAWVTRGIARPIQRMCRFALRIGGGEFGERMEIRGKDEIAQLGTELNRMGERLASLDSERRTFLANVSHELRTPVSNVHVTLEALQNGADEERDLRERFIRTCLDETARLTRLVETLLDLGKLEAGVVSLSTQELSLRRLVQRCERALETRLDARDLRMEVDVAELLIQGDPERLVQAILNLLDNAIRHSPEGRAIYVTSWVEGRTACLQIRDQGPGIKSEDVPYLFDQFFTGDRARRRGGVGLGLAIARRIVEAHGGAITVGGKPNRGAVFIVRLPLSEQAPPREEALAATAFTQP